MKYNRVLTIAGSDSGGGAGIQADIKAISACGCFAASAITAVTVQNTLGVQAVSALPIDIVAGQIDAVLSDIGADAVKVGMLHSSEVVNCVADALRRRSYKHCARPGDGINLGPSTHRGAGCGYIKKCAYAYVSRNNSQYSRGRDFAGTPH